MGHERVGALPRTKRWRDVVHGIAEASSLDGDVHGLANATLRNVRQRLQDVPADTGFVASFEFLLGLAVSARAQGKAASPRTPTINLEENPSALRLARALAEYVTDRRQSAEYAEIARKAATDVIATWTQEQTRQLTITGDHERSAEIWSRASDGRGFCEVSRLFFGKFVERYLNYFIGREASAYLSTTEDRERLARRLAEHIDGVSHHAFETSKITQSFAAGWFNRYAAEGMPNAEQISGFLSHAVGKLGEELLREDSTP